MNMNAKRINLSVIGVLAATLSLISGCGSSSSGSSSSDTINAQAIDGFIVGATVFCDDIENGGTTVGGRLVCPEKTQVIRVRGGTDVGFDEFASTGATPFTGELVAPSSLKYVTPLSSVAVAMTSTSGSFEASEFDASVNMLATSLGLSSLDLNADASKTLQIIKLNAQINEIISGFAASADDYVRVTKEFSNLTRSNAEAQAVTNLTSGVGETLIDLNTRLTNSYPELELEQAELDSLISDLQLINMDIESATEIDDVSLAAATDPTEDSALSLDRSKAPVQFYDYWSGSSDKYTLKHFEVDTLLNDRYFTTINSRYTSVHFGANAFTVNKSMSDTQIGIGFEFVSTTPGDYRKLSVTTTGALLSMVEGFPESMQIKFPENTVFHAKYIERDNTASTAAFNVSSDKIFRSSNWGFGVDLHQLGSVLSDRGHTDITRSEGNYKLTLVINGIKINVIDEHDEFRAKTYSVDSGSGVVTGSGFQGYVTILN